MPNRCKSKTGSFGAHFDELVKHFPRETRAERKSRDDEAARREQRDIHALLFERAWQVEQTKP
ncbi:hypothetical protein H9L13_03510 [Sphingomonas lutea]|uniref:Uncharacterized protein n=1 Tax=Sphingomonas lutea TaxID=1045317 RepID=A0A7G9SJG6_9SPHN|nr:hypothetical protein [Sphingomonas lutea]QNN67991.1 hypothetical protein H9L13_03510 [Sphingomonas lutea]